MKFLNFEQKEIYISRTNIKIIAKLAKTRLSHMTVSVFEIAPPLASVKPSSNSTPPLNMSVPKLLT